MQALTEWLSGLPPIQRLAELGLRFYKAFFEAGRWQLYLKGLGVTFQITIAAISMGLVLGLAGCAPPTTSSGPAAATPCWGWQTWSARYMPPSSGAPP